MVVGNVTSAADAVEAVKALESNLAITWILLCSFLVISMQLGFAMLEVGSVRQAHRMTVLVKNIMDATVSCFAFWVHTQIERQLDPNSLPTHATRHLMVIQWAYCATSVTICSGSMAERTHMTAYLCFSAIMGGLIYPVLASSAWGSTGLFHNHFHGFWTTGYRYHDFAGGGIVHFTGGVAAFMGNNLLGRRIMRATPGIFASASNDDLDPVVSPTQPSHPSQQNGSRELSDLDDADEQRMLLLRPNSGWPRRFDDLIRDDHEFQTLNYLQVIGMFTLWIGWYGFNAGATFCMNAACSFTAGLVAWNTTMAGSFGGIGAYVYCFCVSRNLNTSVLCNGILSGLVAITGCCDICQAWHAAIIGFSAGGLVLPLACRILQYRLLDDPVDAIPVHMFGGFFGILASAFCTPDCEANLGYPVMAEQERFCLPDFSLRLQLCEQVWGLLMIFWWTASTSLLLWGIFAVSELASAMQGQYFTLADNLLCQTLSAEPASQQTSEQWKSVAKYSPAARRVLRQHGWSRDKFVNGAPDDVFSLRMELQQARGEKVETSLEVGNCGVLRRLAIAVHAFWPTRELAVLRLRMAPVSELTGLGAADMNGGTLIGMVRKLAKAQRDARAAHSPLKEEVRELARVVQSQGLLLRSVWRRNGRSRDVREALPTVREENHDCSPTQSETACDTEEWLVRPPPGSPATYSPPLSGLWQASGMTVLGYGGSAAYASMRSNSSGSGGSGGRRPAPHMTPVVMPSVPRFGSSSSINTDRTASDGRLTPHSANEGTPPPSVIGLRSYGGLGAMANTGQANEVAAQLANMMQAQQDLLASLMRAASASNSPSPYGMEGGGNAQHNMLVAALQQLAQQPSNSDGRSNSYLTSNDGISSCSGNSGTISPRV